MLPKIYKPLRVYQFDCMVLFHSQRQRHTCMINDNNLQIIRSPKPTPNGMGTSWSVLLNVSYHKVYHYILFMGGDLNGNPDIRPLMVSVVGN